MIDQSVVNQMRDAQYDLRSALSKLRLALQLHVGPLTVKAYFKTQEAVGATQEFFEVLEEAGEDEEE